MSIEDNTPKYELTEVQEKPSRAFKRKSKYLPIVNNFLEKTVGRNGVIMTLATEGKDANYMRTQIKKIIDNDGLPINVGVANNQLYLERADPIVKKVK